MDRINGLPALGFGTFGRKGEDGIETMRLALETGYRHLDTAQMYENEEEVGEALRRSGLLRGEVWLTTKINMPNFAPGKLVPSLEESLEKLGVDEVDLTLIHWPSPNDEYELETYMTQIAEAKEKGLTRHIGVSNFTIALIDQSIGLLGEGALATNQVELHPYLQNRKLAEHCKSKDIAVTCYQPLAKGTVSDDPKLVEIADKHGATAPQVALAWELAQGFVTIPTTSNADRVAENFGALNVTLDDDDMAAIGELDRGQRRIDPDTAPDWD
ncbi:2,5-didehydrogluconate reductase DkgB [Pelagovum pacificum]|uniref:2,5-didehydrogluconate reductase DkgB n=1 Tax=Pelagovum pacificum TaxID=2588711 RepID=A0A5C5GA70_9RHOB|nr:2,5-didehydrogluconate reductase DkgB [Pelagovum pacificum]QQA42369.1 2,5-didehydrogluconate reductase DkgB [Pelagovum pacificum]TNY31453.1 2,5-didehydrogluconate reductase DkgB [Pelagovum pacificum]